MIQDVFRQQGPFLGSGGRYSPGPTTTSPLLAMRKPLSNDLSLPWVSFRSSPAVLRWGRTATDLSLDTPADGFTRRRSFRARPPFTRPWPLFLERVCRAYSRPVVAYWLLQLHFDVRATKPGLSWPSQGRRPRPPSFSYESRLLPCGSGDPRRAALRPSVPTPVMVPLTCVSLPIRDADADAPPPRVSPAEHSEDWRARVEGPSEGRVPCSPATISRACDGCMHFVAHADGVPLLGDLRTSAVIGAVECERRNRHTRNGPT